MAAINYYNKLSPFQRVILALFFGILAGIFVGEPAGELEIIGNAYIRLLQMTVLPYVLVSIFVAWVDLILTRLPILVSVRPKLSLSCGWLLC